MWSRIKKHPRLAIGSTIALAATAYFVLPMIVGITALSVGIAAATCAIGGLVLGGFLGWVGQKTGLIKPERILPPYDASLMIFKGLPNGLKKIMGSGLDPETLSSAVTPDHSAYNLFKPQLDFNKFLQHVARGEQDEAEAMLIKEAKCSGSGEGKEDKRAILSKLLTSKGTVMDLSGRHFAPLTAFQFALWAKDRHMWQMLLKYLPADKALEQYEEHKKQGVSYQLEGKTIKENHYDFSPLQRALKDYVDYINTYREADRLWLEVGAAQRYVPAHVASEYVREDRSFDPTPTFDEPHLPRARRFYNWLTSSFSAWFSDPGFGTSFSVGRGAGGGLGWGVGAGWQWVPPPCDAGVWVSWARFDLAAITALCKVRTQEYDNLPKYLNAQLRPEDDQPKVVDAAASPRRTFADRRQ